MATVSVITSDPNLFRSVAATLGDEYNIVWGDPPGGREPDLILGHWTEPGRFEGVTAVPVLIVDLWLLSGDSLRDVVGRVLHGYSMRALSHVPFTAGTMRAAAAGRELRAQSFPGLWGRGERRH